MGPRTPHRIRFLCAYDPGICAGVRRIFIRAVASHYKRKARDQGLHDPRVGCVAFTQRFDSALRLNVQFHTLWPDGTFTRPPLSLADPTFHPAAAITDSDIDKLAFAVRRRVLHFLRKHGKLPDDDAPADDPELLEPSLLQVLGAASVHGRIALGPKAGAYVPRLGRGSMDGGGEIRHGKLCADVDGWPRQCPCCLHPEATDQSWTQRPAEQVLPACRNLHPELRTRETRTALSLRRAPSSRP